MNFLCYRNDAQTPEPNEQESIDGIIKGMTVESETVANSREHDGVFEVQAQLWADNATQPLQDALVECPEDVSAYRTVATLRLPRQEVYGTERVRYFDEVMTFRPAHSLAAHRPLGIVIARGCRSMPRSAPFAVARAASPS